MSDSKKFRFTYRVSEVTLGAHKQWRVFVNGKNIDNRMYYTRERALERLIKYLQRNKDINFETLEDADDGTLLREEDLEDT